MKLKKGSPEAKKFMAKLRAKKGKSDLSGWAKGNTRMIEMDEKPFKKLKNVRVKRTKDGVFNKFKVIPNMEQFIRDKRSSLNGDIGKLFDTSTINNLDDLKRQYYQLAKQYHPDSGGTTAQFQELQKVYEAHFNILLKGGNLTKEQETNEIVIDEAIRNIIDNLINLDGLTIEIIGKWLWVGGNTKPLRVILKSVGLEFIFKGTGASKEGFWVYKGTDSKSRGKMSIEDIRKAYGSTIVKGKYGKKLSGVKVFFDKDKVTQAFKKLITGLNKRYK
jgi:hypothetical protein